MPVPDNKRQKGAATPESKQVVAPQNRGQANVNISPVGGPAGQLNSGVQIGRQAQIVNPGTGLFEAISGAARGAQQGIQNFQALEKNVSESRYAEFETAYIQESERVKGDPTKMISWMDQQEYRPTRITASRYHSQRAKLQGLSDEQYTESELRQLSNQASLLAPVDQLEFYNTKMELYAPDSDVYKALENSRNKLRATVSSSNWETSQEMLRQTWQNETNEITAQLLASGVPAADLQHPGFRRLMEMYHVGAGEIKFDPQNPRMVTVDGETIDLAGGITSDLDLMLQEKLGSWAGTDQARLYRLESAMQTSAPSHALLSGAKPNGPAKENYLAAMNAASRGRFDNASRAMQAAIDLGVEPGKDMTTFLKDSFDSVVNDPNHSSAENLRALISMDQIFDFEARQGWWESRGIYSQEAVNELRKNSGYEKSLKTATMASTDEATAKHRQARIANRFSTEGLNTANAQYLNDLIKTFSSTDEKIEAVIVNPAFTARRPTQKDVEIQGQFTDSEGRVSMTKRMSPVEFQKAVREGKIDLNKGSYYFQILAPAGSNASKLDIQIPLSSDDMVVIGPSGAEPNEATLRELAHRREEREFAEQFEQALAVGNSTDPAVIANRELIDVAALAQKAVGVASVEGISPEQKAQSLNAAWALLMSPNFRDQQVLDQLDPDSQKLIVDSVMRGIRGQDYAALINAGSDKLIAAARGEISPADIGVSESALRLWSVTQGVTTRSAEFMSAIRESRFTGDKDMWMLTHGVKLARELQNAGTTVTPEQINQVYDYVRTSGVTSNAVGTAFEPVLAFVEKISLDGEVGTSDSAIVTETMVALQDRFAQMHPEYPDLGVALSGGYDAERQTQALKWVQSSVNELGTFAQMSQVLMAGNNPLSADGMARQILRSGIPVSIERSNQVPSFDRIDYATYDPSNQGRTGVQSTADRVMSLFGEIAGDPSQSISGGAGLELREFAKSEFMPFLVESKAGEITRDEIFESLSTVGVIETEAFMVSRGADPAYARSYMFVVTDRINDAFETKADTFSDPGKSMIEGDSNVNMKGYIISPRAEWFQDRMDDERLRGITTNVRDAFVTRQPRYERATLTPLNPGETGQAPALKKTQPTIGLKYSSKRPIRLGNTPIESAWESAKDVYWWFFDAEVADDTSILGDIARGDMARAKEKIVNGPNAEVRARVKEKIDKSPIGKARDWQRQNEEQGRGYDDMLRDFVNDNVQKPLSDFFGQN